MNYWTIQLHPNDLTWNREKELLEKHSVIGLGRWEKDPTNQQYAFENTMEIGDLVIVKRGTRIIALVEVTGGYEYDETTDDLLWFERRRKVKILDWYDDRYGYKVQPRKSLERLVDSQTDQYKAVTEWKQRVGKKRNTYDVSDQSVKFEECGISDIYSFKLNIPDYQRIYTWGSEQVITLLDDIVANNLSKYFLGSIVLHHNGDNYDIVDGQQRLVTLALIHNALCNTDEKIKNFLECKYKSVEAQENIIRNYQIIQKYIDGLSDKKGQLEGNLEKLAFAVLIIDNKNLDLAFRFFSNTNSKGKKLTDYDLLKPHHLRYIPSDCEEQQRHLAHKWDAMIREHQSIDFIDGPAVDKNIIPYVRLMEIILFRLRNWARYDDDVLDLENHSLKKMFEAAPIIEEIPPFGEQFHFEEPIQGGQHFFAYVDFFRRQYSNFKMKESLFEAFGNQGSHSWYGSVIEALVFCYYLKFGDSYIDEAMMAITRYIATIRFRKGRAYKPTITNWAMKSKIVCEIQRSSSPTFFLAFVEGIIDDIISHPDEKEDASSGVRYWFYEICRKLTDKLSGRSTTDTYKDYFTKRYGYINRDDSAKSGEL